MEQKDICRDCPYYVEELKDCEFGFCEKQEEEKGDEDYK